MPNSWSIYIHPTPAPVWEALTNPSLTRQYFDFMEGFMRVDSSWEPGTPLRYGADDGGVHIEGEIVAASALLEANGSRSR
jgi:uncharacterized protein YndB with AHSA1/START domain